MVTLQTLSGSEIVQWNVQMAGALLTVLVRGLLAGSVKG